MLCGQGEALPSSPRRCCGTRRSIAVHLRAGIGGGSVGLYARTSGGRLSLAGGVYLPRQNTTCSEPTTAPKVATARVAGRARPLLVRVSYFPYDGRLVPFSAVSVLCSCAPSQGWKYWRNWPLLLAINRLSDNVGLVKCVVRHPLSEKAPFRSSGKTSVPTNTARL